MIIDLPLAKPMGGRQWIAQFRYKDYAPCSPQLHYIVTFQQLLEVHNRTEKTPFSQ